MRAIQVIDEGGKLAALQEGDLVDAKGSHAADLMPVAHPRDDPVQQVGQCRGSHFQDLGSGLLGHDLAQGAESPLQTVGDARIRRCPWDRLLQPPVRRAVDLLRCVPEQDFHPHERDVFPLAELSCLAYDPATPPTFRAAAAILVWLDRQMQFLVAVLEPETGDFHSFQA